MQSCFALLGKRIGSSIDNKKSSITYTVTNDELDRIDLGNLVKIYTLDGQVLKGRFQGIEAQYDYDLVFLQSKKELLQIRSSEIEEIKIEKERKKNWWIFTSAGLVIDVILLEYIISGRWYDIDIY